MKTCFLAIGGCGAKVARALVYCALAGMLPEGETQVVLVDTDQRDEATPALFAAYERVRFLLPGRVALTCRRWPDKLMEGQRLRDWAKAEDALLLEALLPEGAADLDITRGFGGRSDAAMLALTGMLRTQAGGALQELVDSLGEEDARVVLCASAMGGTGEAGLTLVAEYLREQLPRAQTAAVVLLPYFRGGEQAQDKAAAALRQWVEDGLCRSMYLLGLPQEGYAAAPEGCREARLVEWLAALCAADYFRRGGEGQHGWQAEADRLDWSSFGAAGEECARRFGALTGAAILLRADMGPVIRQGLREPRWLRDRLIPWYAGCFGQVRRMSPDLRLKTLEDFESLTALLGAYEGWLGEIIATLPPRWRRGSGLAEAMRTAEETYGQAVRLSAQLTVTQREAEESGLNLQQMIHRGQRVDDDAERVQAAIEKMRADLALLEARRRENLARTGGQAYMLMLRDFEQRCRREAEHMRGQIREGEEHIRRAEEAALTQDLGRIATARTKLERMGRSLALLEARHDRVTADMLSARQEGVKALPPSLPQGAGGCDLFDPSALEAGDRKAVERTLGGLIPGRERAGLARLRERLARCAPGEEPLRTLMTILLEEGEA